MRKGIAILIGCLLLGSSAAMAQNAPKHHTPKGFQNFRDQLMNDYTKFKTQILEHYADFLNGEWHEFEVVIESEKPYLQEKPKEMPSVMPMPEDNIAIIPQESIITNQIEEVIPVVSADTTASSESVLPLESNDDKSNFNFDFYGMQMSVPSIEFDILESVTAHKETGNHWEMMSAQKGGEEVSKELAKLAAELGLNGYLTFRLAEKYVGQRFKDSDLNARMSAVHYLLSYMGYDVRLVEYKDILTVMMPFDQETVVGMPCLVKKDTGRKYFLLLPEDYKDGSAAPTIKTCVLPKNAGGKTSDLKLTGLNIPFKGKKFDFRYGPLKLSGEVNENIKDLLFHYPLMPFGDYASSWIDQSLRDTLTAQVKQQLDGMSQKDAINTLLSFCHYGFAYKSDDDWLGCEKPYFMEENFLYDYNDCEDRAIFMSYLVWNALGVPCQLLKYPGHESVAVAIDEDVEGQYYTTDGKKYFSSDPTYRGSQVGMVMDVLLDVKPSIDKHYK